MHLYYRERLSCTTSHSPSLAYSSRPHWQPLVPWFLADSCCHTPPQGRTASPLLLSGFSDADTQNAWENLLCVHTYAAQQCGLVGIPWGNSQPVEDLNQMIKMSPFVPLAT